MKSFLITVAIIILAGVGIYFIKEKSNKTTEETQSTSEDSGNVSGARSDALSDVKDTDIVLFYGSTCPHCKKVEQFLSDNKIIDKVPYKQLEVYGDKQNAEFMKTKQNACKNLSEDDKGGVPFLYTPEKCLVGDTPIIDYFKEKAGI